MLDGGGLLGSALKPGQSQGASEPRHPALLPKFGHQSLHSTSSGSACVKGKGEVKRKVQRKILMENGSGERCFTCFLEKINRSIILQNSNRDQCKNCGGAMVTVLSIAETPTLECLLARLAFDWHQRTWVFRGFPSWPQVIRAAHCT